LNQKQIVYREPHLTGEANYSLGFIIQSAFPSKRLSTNNLDFQLEYILRKRKENIIVTDGREKKIKVSNSGYLI